MSSNNNYSTRCKQADEQTDAEWFLCNMLMKKTAAFLESSVLLLSVAKAMVLNSSKLRKYTMWKFLRSNI